MTNKRKLANQIKFLNMGNEDFIKDLQTHAKVFFPRVSQDLHKASSGQMMIENAAFIGDVLAFYLEQRFKNSNLFTADDIDQIYNLSQFLGYKPSGPPPARDFTNFYLEVPSTSSTTGFGPDMRYAVNFKNVQLTNNNGVVFEALEDVDFSGINPSSSLEARVSKRASDGSPSHFVLKVSEEVIGARTITETVNVGNYKAFREIEISEPNVIDIVSVEDSDGDKFYEVNYLAQEAIFEGIKNGGSDEEDVPYILKLKTVPKRFVKRTNPSTGKTSLVFGAGKAVDVGTAFIPDPADLAIDLKGRLTFAPEFIDPQNFLKTKTLGLAPYNTTLTIKARVGGGPRTNTSAESLRQIVSKEADFASAGLDIVEVNNTLKSFSTNNVKPIRGGDNAETVEEIKANAAAFFAAQGRLITREDYIARSLSLPPKFGKVFRVSANNNCDTNGGLQLWVIAKDSNGNLVPPSDSLRKN